MLLFGFPFLDSMKTYGTLPKNYNSLELIRNIFAIIFSYFYYVHILYIYAYFHVYISTTWPRRAVGNVSGNRCESDCRSRGREFDPGPVPYFRGD